MILKIFSFFMIVSVGGLSIACTKNSQNADSNYNAIESHKVQFGLYEINGIKINDPFDSNKLKRYTEEMDGCFLAKEINSKNGLSYEINNGIVTIIGTSEKGVLSPYGVAVGDRVDQIYKKHQNDIKPEILNDENGSSSLGENIFIYYWKDSNKNLGLKYSVDSGIVTSISIGTLIECM